MVPSSVASYKCLKIKWVNRFYLFVDGDDCWYLLLIEKYSLDGAKKLKFVEYAELNNASLSQLKNNNLNRD